LTYVNDVQSIVLNNRRNSQSRAVGLVIELYNTSNDPDLTEILATTNIITISTNNYRFDFPAIETYTSGFGDDTSITQIISETSSIKEDATINDIDTDVNINSNVTISGEVICNDLIVNESLNVDTITTTGYISIGGVIKAPNQIGFLAFSKSASSVSGNNTQKLPYNQVKYNIGGHYDTTTYIFTCPLVGRYLFFVNYFTISGNSATVDLIRDDGTTELTILRSQGSASPSNNEGRSAHIVIDCNIGDQLYGLMRNDAIRLSPFTYSDYSIYGPFGVQLLS